MSERQLYIAVASTAALPHRDKTAVAVGRGGVMKIPRNFHLSAAEIAEQHAKNKEAGRFLSPYSKKGIYYAIIEACSILGENKPHVAGIVFIKFKEIMNDENTRNTTGKTLLQRFESKVPRNSDTSRDPLGKFLHNVDVLQRLGGNTPYGLKLIQMGACLDVLEDAKKRVLIQLRTGVPKGQNIVPINMNRKRAYSKTCCGYPSGLLVGDSTVPVGEIASSV